MASRTPHRSTRLSSRKEMATPETNDETAVQDEQLEGEELALVPTDDEDEEVQDVVPVEERGLTGARRATTVSRHSFVDTLPRWIPSYLRDSIAELLKVTWPSQKETRNLTLVVIVMAAIFTVVFGLLDVLFFDALNAVINHLK